MNGAVKPVSVLPVNVFACALLDSPLFVVAYSQLRTRLLEREREREASFYCMGRSHWDPVFSEMHTNEPHYWAHLPGRVYSLTLAVHGN